MKRKEAIKQIQEGKIQVCNDLLPSTKEIKKFLKEVFPYDYYLEKYPNEVDEINRRYFQKASYDKIYWVSSNGCKKSLPIINLSTITKRKKTKLSQLEKQFSDLAKDVVELRQTLAKDVEVDVEEIQQETIKEEEIEWSVPQFLVHEDGQVLLSTGLCENNMFEATVIISSVAYKKGDKTMFRQDVFKPFNGELIIK